jgi:hypothetical protein
MSNVTYHLISYLLYCELNCRITIVSAPSINDFLTAGISPVLVLLIQNPKDIDIMLHVDTEETGADLLEHKHTPICAPTATLTVHAESERAASIVIGAYEDEFLREEVDRSVQVASDTKGPDSVAISPGPTPWKTELHYNTAKVYIPVSIVGVDAIVAKSFSVVEGGKLGLGENHSTYNSAVDKFCGQIHLSVRVAPHPENSEDSSFQIVVAKILVNFPLF